MTEKTKKKNLTLSKIGLAFFAIGSVIAVGIIAVIVWANLEVFGFYPSFDSEGSIRSLNCPIFMTTNEQATFSAKFENPLDYVIRPTIRTVISQGSVILVDDIRETISIEPKETIKLSWNMDSSKTVYGQFVFARVVLMNNFPLDDAQGSCGVYVINTELFTGRIFLYIALAVILTLMLGGVFIWKRFTPYGYRSTKNTRIALWMISITILVGLGAGLLHFWMISGFALIAGVLLLIATATMSMTQTQ